MAEAPNAERQQAAEQLERTVARPWNLEAEGWKVEVEVEVEGYPVAGKTLDALDESFEEVEARLEAEFGRRGQAYTVFAWPVTWVLEKSDTCRVGHLLASVRFRFHLPVPGAGLPAHIQAIAETRCRASREHERVHAEIVMGRVLGAVLEATASTAEDCDALRASLRDTMARSRRELERLNTLFDAEVRRRSAADEETGHSPPGEVNE